MNKLQTERFRALAVNFRELEAELAKVAEGDIADTTMLERARNAVARARIALFKDQDLSSLDLDRLTDWFSERIDGLAPALGRPCAAVAGELMDEGERELLMRAQYLKVDRTGVPERERWLYENRDALFAVLTGVESARAGKFAARE